MITSAARRVSSWAIRVKTSLYIYLCTVEGLGTAIGYIIVLTEFVNVICEVMMTDDSPSNIQVDLALYGEIAAKIGGVHVAQKTIELPAGACVGDLLDQIGLADAERSYVFINAILCDMPGLKASRAEPLHQGDHIGIFSTRHMWPYQYRDGVRMSERLRAVLNEVGAMHHSYKT